MEDAHHCKLEVVGSSHSHTHTYTENIDSGNILENFLTETSSLRNLIENFLHSKVDIIKDKNSGCGRYSGQWPNRYLAGDRWQCRGVSFEVLIFLFFLNLV